MFSEGNGLNAITPLTQTEPRALALQPDRWSALDLSRVGDVPVTSIARKPVEAPKSPSVLDMRSIEDGLSRAQREGLTRTAMENLMKSSASPEETMNMGSLIRASLELQQHATFSHMVSSSSQKLERGVNQLLTAA